MRARTQARGRGPPRPRALRDRPPHLHGFGHRRHVRPPTPSVGLQRRPAFGALVPCTQLLSVASTWMSQRPLKPTCPKQSSRVSPSQTKHTSESFSASNSSSSANERPPARPFPKTLGASCSLAHLHLDGGPVANCVDSTSAAPVGAVSPQSPCRHHARPYHRRRPCRPLPCSRSFSSPIHFPHSGDVLGGRHEAAFLTPLPGTTQTFPRHSRKARSPLRPRSPCTVAPSSPGPGLMPALPRPRQQALTPRPPAWPMTK